MNCLLCGQTIKSDLIFCHLLLFKNENNYLCSACQPCVKIVNFGVKKRFESIIMQSSHIIKL